MARIFLTHSAESLANYYGPDAVAALRKLGDVRINPTGAVLDTQALLAQSHGCEIIVCDRQTRGDGAFFDGAPDAVAFVRGAVDIRNIDVAAASRNGVLVTHATPGFVASVAEAALGFIIDLARHTHSAVHEYRAGSAATARMGRQLKGSVLGIIGYGVIGAYLAPIGKTLGMTVLANDPHKTIGEPDVRQVPLDALLRESDFVVCLAVATAETESLMNEHAFAQMKPTAYFINLSRGGLVDESALEKALNERRIAGAAMDVGRAPDEKPSLFLARRDDVVATPHAAGLTPQAIAHQAFDTVGQVADLIAGRLPPGAVNSEHAARLVRLRQP
jgi:D-3-phosphoglycerate dehydrogenase / 2-oxoglutarate reductase